MAKQPGGGIGDRPKRDGEKRAGYPSGPPPKTPPPPLPAFIKKPPPKKA